MSDSLDRYFPDSIKPTEVIASAVPDRDCLQRRLRTIFWLLSIVLGAFYALIARHSMNPDGMAYLDIGEAYLRGDWNMAINAYWSPFYSWLLGLAMLILKPSPYWEFFVVHLVNFAIFLCALGCFHFFLHELIRYHRDRVARFSGDGGVILPEWAWLALGYSLFIWSSLTLITITTVSPDMCVAAFIYLASGILLRIRTRSASLLMFVLLGVVLGFGYLAKAPMFPLAFVFLGVSVFSVGNFRKAVPRVLIALVVFLLIAGPFIIAISKAKGRLTFGDSARIAYASSMRSSSVSNSRYAREISDGLATYESGMKGTYPLNYDPSYWYESVVPHFDLKRQIKRFMTNVSITYLDLFFLQQGGLVVGILILYLMSCRRWLCIKDIAEHWGLLIPAIAGLGMYSLIWVEMRYIGAFLVLLWMGVFSGVALPDSQESRRLVACVAIAMLLFIMIPIGVSTARLTYYESYDLRSWQDIPAHEHWQVADGLKRMGIQPGDKVASIGSSWGAYWARLARVQIVAEALDFDGFGDVNHFSAKALALARTGAKAIIGKPASCVSTVGWQRIGNTDYYVYILPR